MSLTLPEFPLIYERFRLRPVEERNIDSIHSYRSMDDVARYLPHEPHTRAHTATTVTSMIQQSALHVPGQWLDLAVEYGDSPEAIGEVLLKSGAQDPTMGQVGFVFHPSVHGTGLATEAVTASLRIAFDQFTWERVIGVCDKRNLRSAALMERVGMRREAEFRDAVISKGERTTQLQYAMTRGEWRDSHVHGDRGRTRDQREIDTMMSVFFSAFTSLDLKPVDLTELRQMFLADAIVAVAAQGVVRQYDVESFIDPRQELLNSGRLRDFSEREVTADTQIFGDIAQRWSLYSKSGTLDARSAEGWGRKATHFARTPDGWRISAIIWQDGAEGTQIPTA